MAAKRQWFGWVVHARQERGDYMALVAIVTTFGVGMIAVGSYIAVSEKHHFPLWLANVLLIAGVSIILLMVLVALILGALPFFTRPKLRLGEITWDDYMDERTEELGTEHGGVKSCRCAQVEVSELRGVKAREVEVWVTAIDPVPKQMTVALPVQIPVFDLSGALAGDVSPKSRRCYKLWVDTVFNDHAFFHLSRLGSVILAGSDITLEIHHESWKPDSRTYKIDVDLIAQNS